MKLEEYQRMADQQRWHWWYRTKRSYLEQVLAALKLPSPARILDLGSGVGANFPVLRKFGQVEGVEQSSLGRQLSQKNHPEKVQTGDLNAVSLPASHYDLITILDVLYHQAVTDDVKVLRQALSGLQQGGYLVITDCAHPWLFGPHDEANMARQRYTLKELQEKVERAGGKVVRSSYLFGFSFPLFIMARMVERLSGKTSEDQAHPGLLNTVLGAMGQVEAQLLKMINLPVGSSILIVAKKEL